MKISNNPSHNEAGQIPLEMLAANPNVSDADKVGEVARQFEAVLLRQILQEGRKTEGAGDDKSSASSIYDDMINNQLADSISRSGSFGLAKSLQTQLTKQVLGRPAKETPNSH